MPSKRELETEIGALRSQVKQLREQVFEGTRAGAKLSGVYYIAPDATLKGKVDAIIKHLNIEITAEEQESPVVIVKKKVVKKNETRRTKKR